MVLHERLCEADRLVQAGDNWYYMDNSGAMAAGRWIGNYYVEANGVMATNKWIGNYYVDNTGCWTKTRVTAQ